MSLGMVIRNVEENDEIKWNNHDTNIDIMQATHSVQQHDNNNTVVNIQQEVHNNRNLQEQASSSG